MMELNHRNGLWIGTKEYANFVPAPRRGASASSDSWSEDAIGKNGGGYVSQSLGRHKVYQYDWGRGTDRRYANFIQGLRDGVYGRGVIHFTDPTCYETNVLPPHWASPGMGLNFDAPPLVFRHKPEPFEFGKSDRANTPLVGATYRDLPYLEDFSVEDACFVAIPPGMDFLFGSRYTTTSSSAGIWLFPVTKSGYTPGIENFQVIPNLDEVQPFRYLTSARVSGAEHSGVYIWVGRSGGEPQSSVSILDMVGMLVPSNTEIDWDTERLDQPWYGGEGHSGCRIVGQPTIDYDSKNFTSISATFKEVGAWELASRL